MGRFNLIDTPWIVVMTKSDGSTKEVSLIELFTNAHQYLRLAGETPAQDFAVLRFLLAILHTVFSRFDGNGVIHNGIEVDEKFLQTKFLKDEEEIDEYKDQLLDMWSELWNKEKLPSIIIEYLMKWYDRFFLFSDKYPFYQVSEAELNSRDISLDNTTVINVKFINRLISESNNKVDLFSPMSDSYKNYHDNSSFARWLIAYQGYTGRSEKCKFPGMTVSASHGWLLGLGSIYLNGKNIKETLLLNLVLPAEEVTDSEIYQRPLWELGFDEKLRSLDPPHPHNLAELYTNWSRLIWINPEEWSSSDNKDIRTIQLPGINSQDFFLEKMTLWQFPKSGPNKQHFIPKTHVVGNSFWRSFGNTTLPNSKEDNHRRPGIIDWHNILVDKNLIDERNVKITAVGLGYNRDASSMVNSDIYDELNLHDKVLSDELDDGWVIRITDEVELIKATIEKTLKWFVNDILFIRQMKFSEVGSKYIDEAYYEIDEPFRNWVESIHPEDEKSVAVQRWRSQLREIIKGEADKFVKNASSRDYLGRVKDSRTVNIAESYNKFIAILNNQIKRGG